MPKSPKQNPTAARKLSADLIEVIERRDRKRVQELLHLGVSPNTTDKHGTPALHCALYETREFKGGDECIALLLLKAGAEPDKADGTKATPLLLACKNGFDEVVRFLLQKGVNLSARTYGGVFSYGETPLSIAAGRGHREIVRMLLNAGADVNQPLRKGVTALASAANDIKMVRELVAVGGKATGIALFSPINRGDLEVVTALLAAGASSEVNINDRWGNTILGAAVQSGHSDIVRVVIQAGAKLDAITSGRTPLILAVCSQKLNLVDLLLVAGAKVNARDIYKCTALMEAAGRPDASIVSRLLAAGANPRLKMENGQTAMDFACHAEQTENVKLLKMALSNKTRHLPQH